MSYPDNLISQSLVKRIQEGLEHYDVPSACETEIKGELYTKANQVYREVTRELVESYCSYLSEQICDALHQLEQQGAKQVLNVCSAGCGDGGADHKMLSKVYQTYPTASINYVGIDINEASCSQVKEALSSLPPSCKVNVINSSILEVDTKSLPRFDIVILAHVHYYFGGSSLSPLFVKLLELCRPQSGRIEVIADLPTHIWYLKVIFGTTQIDGKHLMEFIPSLGLPYLTRNLPSKVHCGDLFGPDSAQSPEADAEALLMFLCQRNLKAYPASIVSLCAAYVKSCLDPKGQCDHSSLAISLQRNPACVGK